MMESIKITASQEDYLKLIWKMIQEGQRVSVQAIARRHGVKPPSVLTMLKVLKRADLVTYDRQNGVSLTPHGHQLALQLIRKHRIIETFLKHTLNLDNDSVHQEAELLEHVVSDHVIGKMDETLGFPRQDPHGSVIPKLQEQQQKQMLSELEKGQFFIVQEISLDQQNSSFLEKHGFTPGSKWQLINHTPQRSSFLVSQGDIYLPLSIEETDKIQVIAI